jgi:hypothetical protein
LLDTLQKPLVDQDIFIRRLTENVGAAEIGDLNMFAQIFDVLYQNGEILVARNQNGGIEIVFVGVREHIDYDKRIDTLLDISGRGEECAVRQILFDQPLLKPSEFFG